MDSKLLIVAPGHPDLEEQESPHPAYELRNAYSKLLGRENVYYLGLINAPEGWYGIRHYQQQDYLWQIPQEADDTTNIVNAAKPFTDFLRAVDPDLLHAHIEKEPEILELAARAVPNAALLATLSGPAMLCTMRGFIPGKSVSKICEGIVPLACARCSNGNDLAALWLKKRRMLHFLGFADRLITASNFLQNRYLEAGVNPDTIHTIPNPVRRHITKKDAPNLPRNRFAFFGELSEGSGIETLFQALRSIPRDSRKNLILEIHGSNLAKQPEAFQKRMAAYCNEFAGDGFLRWLDPFYASEAEEKMGNIDWVIFPSTQWENCPPVIQQAFACGRPVIASDTIALKEFVKDDINGLLFKTASSIDLSRVLKVAAANKKLWEKLHLGITANPLPGEVAQRHLDLVWEQPDPWDI